MFLKLTLWGYGLQSPLKGRLLTWAGHVARMQECIKVFKILTSKATGKRLLRRSSYRWEDNISGS